MCLYSKERLADVLQSVLEPGGVKSPADVIERVIAGVNGFAEQVAQADDITMLAVQRRG